MQLVDCGVSGAPEEASETTWGSLGLAAPWPAVLRLLSGTRVPRPVQVGAFRDALILETRRHLLVAAPTNAGKSLVGTAALLDAIRHGGRAVLLEPLRELAREKAEELQSHCLAVGAALGIELRVTLTTGDYRLSDEHLADPPPRSGQVVVATPERFDAILRNPAHHDWTSSLSAVCVDEAHLIGNPRRGATLEYVVTSLLTLPHPPRLVLLSASLGETDRVREWLDPCDVVRVSLRQPPLRKSVAALGEGEDAETAVTELVGQAATQPDSAVLVFVYQTASTAALCRVLNERFPGRLGANGAMPYHAQMSAQTRASTRRAMETGETRCVVTTTALGLGVNLPATHVVVRDISFPGEGPLPIADVLQMAGRAGRRDRSGSATVLRRHTDPWPLAELTRQLREEPLPEMASSFNRVACDARRPEGADAVPTAATLVATQLGRHDPAGQAIAELKQFFQRSLGGERLAALVDGGLGWLTDSTRVLAHRDESGQYRLTALGARAVRAMLPLEIAAGVGQLIRDLLQCDGDDRWLARWTPLDHLVVLECLSPRPPSLRRFGQALPDQLDSWMEAHPNETPVLYREWVRGGDGKSRADQLLGSLGITREPAAARAAAHLAVLRAIVLSERGAGVPAADLERRWSLTNLGGVEERWRDRQLWLLAALKSVLETPCFYYCLREHCGASDDRVRRVTSALQTMRAQIFGIQEHLKYCSPLGGVLRSMRRTQSTSIGPATVRRLETAGVTSLATLATLSVDRLVELGVRRDRASAIGAYLQRRSG